MKLEAREFNRAAEDFYRDGLRRQHLREAVAHLREDVADLERFACDETKIRLRHGVRVQDLARFLQDAEQRVLTDDLSLPEITALLNLMLVLTEWDRARAAQAAEGRDATPVH